MPGSDKRKLAELSLIFGLPNILKSKTKVSSKSQMQTLQKKLQKLIMTELVPVSQRISKEEIQEVDDQLDDWLKAHGLWERPQNKVALISFYLDMVENSPFTYNPRIMKTLNRMAEHLENSKKTKYSDFVFATKIAESWQEISRQEETWQNQKDLQTL